MLEQPKLVVKCQYCNSTGLKQDGNMHQCQNCGNYQPNVKMVKPFDRDALFIPKE